MQKRNITAISILVCIVAALAFLQTPIMSHARQRAWLMWMRTTASIFGLGAIEADETVIEQLQQLRLENIRLRAQLGDYDRLRQQLGTLPLSASRLVPAATIGRPIDSFRSQYLINKGRRQGVTQGAPVVTGGSVLVGFINLANDETSVVQSLLNPATNLTVEAVPLADAKATPLARGLLQSYHYTTLVVTTIPKDTPVEVGQAIVTVSKEAGIPYGLVIGTVAQISSQEHEPYQEARLKLPYDLDQVDAVQVIVPL